MPKWSFRLIKTLKRLLFVLRSGVFTHADYAQRYLNSRDMYHFAFIHYLLVGEKRGNLPNPFFDPQYFKQKSGSCRLSDYLCDEAFWKYSPSPAFDTLWYASQNCGWQATARHPFIHFWAQGFDDGRNPSKEFDIAFFKKAVMRDRPDKKAFCFELFTAITPNFPWNSTQLKARRDVFYSKIVLDVLRCPKQVKSRFLVFVQVSGDSKVPFLNVARSFDVALNYYDGSNLPDNLVASEADYVIRQVGTKTTAIKSILEVRPEIFLSYEAVLFLDDDVSISTPDVEKLFNTMSTYGLDLAQASLSRESRCYFDVLKQPNPGTSLIPLTAVEIMMPVISSRALSECGWVFQEGMSGWGIDLLLSAKVRERFGNTIALVGDAVARHEQETDTVDGPFYRFLRTRGIDATIEMGDIAIRFDIDDTQKAIAIHHEPLRRSVDAVQTVAVRASKK
jgi:hypothetical protein